MWLRGKGDEARESSLVMLHEWFEDTRTLKSYKWLGGKVLKTHASEVRPDWNYTKEEKGWDTGPTGNTHNKCLREWLRFLAPCQLTVFDLYVALNRNVQLIYIFKYLQHLFQSFLVQGSHIYQPGLPDQSPSQVDPTHWARLLSKTNQINQLQLCIQNGAGFICSVSKKCN